MSFDSAEYLRRPSVELPNLDLDISETKSTNSKGGNLVKPVILRYADVIRTVPGTYSQEYYHIKNLTANACLI